MHIKSYKSVKYYSTLLKVDKEVFKISYQQLKMAANIALNIDSD